MAQKTAITPTRSENFAEWYQSVISGACMADNSPVRGCMVIRPWGYALWEKMQSVLDKKFKETGHENAYFPLLIPLSFLAKEAEHVEGFAKECAVVTHHRLEMVDGKLVPSPTAKLEEPFVIRPTSETIIGDSFSKWVQSYRDLPILVNQWANVMRWEMRTRMFLRTSEFLWQEGHTVHATADDAMAETHQMLEVYEWFMQEYLAMPVLKGEKTPEERFAGADNTYTVEAMMQSKKALQAGTSHFLGQHFAKASDIKFSNKNGEIEYAWTTSWGVSTRMIGGLIMCHSDDDGLVLPPRIAPKQVVILPFLGKENESAVLEYCENLKKQLEQLSFFGEKIEVILDKTDKPNGKKYWDWVRKGVPLRIEVGGKEMEQKGCTLSRRDADASVKQFVPLADISTIPTLLEEMQENIFKKAKAFRDENITKISSLEEFKNHFAEEDAGFVLCYADEAVNETREKILKDLKVTARCIPFAFNQNNAMGVCIFSGKPTASRIIYARAY